MFQNDVISVLWCAGRWYELSALAYDTILIA